MAGKTISAKKAFEYTWPGARVRRTNNQERGTVIHETYTGPWAGFQPACFVRFDRDYACHVLKKHLQVIKTRGKRGEKGDK